MRWPGIENFQRWFGWRGWSVGCRLFAGRVERDLWGPCWGFNVCKNSI